MFSFCFYESFLGGYDSIFTNNIDRYTHILSTYIGSAYDYYDFIDTQLNDFIL
ncbi:hypothetical protein [Clostridioides sp. GD02404]|uniref:hypothetical protein n=1 Tax=Clostridioides sp. GD02404 TaxID=3054354 RepID=UPI000B0B7749